MSKNNMTCYGRYYNFKKGFEFCKNYQNCPYFDQDAINMVANQEFEPIWHKYIKEFRQCNKYQQK